MIEVVAAVIIHQGKALIARRAPHKSLPGKWEFPGGKVEDGESHEEALERELFEEFNIHTRTGVFVGSNIHPYDHISINLLAYYSEYISGDFNLTDHDKIEWVPLDQLINYDLADADIPFISIIQSNKNPKSTPE